MISIDSTDLKLMTFDLSYLREESKASQFADNAVGFWRASTIAMWLKEKQREREKEIEG